MSEILELERVRQTGRQERLQEQSRLHGVFFVCLFVFGFLFVCFLKQQTGFLCIALAVLELTLQTRLALISEIRLPLPPRELELQACTATTTQLYIVFLKVTFIGGKFCSVVKEYQLLLQRTQVLFLPPTWAAHNHLMQANQTLVNIK